MGIDIMSSYVFDLIEDGFDVMFSTVWYQGDKRWYICKVSRRDSDGVEDSFIGQSPEDAIRAAWCKYYVERRCMKGDAQQ